MSNRISALMLGTALCLAAWQVNAQESDLSFLDTLGGTNSYAASINNSGHIVGWSDVVSNAGYRASLWESIGSNNYNEQQLANVDGINANSQALSLNNEANIIDLHITGWATATDGTTVPALWASNSAYRLDSLDGQISTGSINAINDSLYMVGSSNNTANLKQSSFWLTKTGASGFTVDPLGDTSIPTTPSSVNSEAFGTHFDTNNGISVTVGYSELNGNKQAVKWIDSVNGFTTLNDLNGTESVALDLNGNGQIIGYANSASDTAVQPILWEQDGANYTPTALSTLAGTDNGQALALNAGGEVVGYSSDGTNQFATLWRDNTAIDLNNHIAQSLKDAGWVLLEATDINDSGTIIGNAFNTDTNVSSGFALSAVVVASNNNVSAVPEPQQFVLLLSGLVLLPLAKRRFN